MNPFSVSYVDNVLWLCSSCTQVPGMFDLHLRRAQFERYYGGAEARERFPNHLVRLVTDGMIPEDKLQLLPEIMLPFYLECGLRPQCYPSEYHGHCLSMLLVDLMCVSCGPGACFGME